MFFRELKYTLLTLLRSKELIFWTLVFPFALCTFMYMAFGNIFETTEKFDPIPTAIVQKGENVAFRDVIEKLSVKGEDQLLIADYMAEEEAEKSLEDEKVQGIIYIDENVSLKIKDNGMDQTILQMILNQFAQHKKLITDIGQKNPEKVANVVKVLEEEVDIFVEENKSEGNQDNVTNYFYAIFAMTCLFASFTGCDMILRLQANMSPLGQRRNMARMGKMKMVLANFAAADLVQYTLVCLLLFYMRVVLKIEIGNEYGAILLILFAGTSFGLMFGILIGSLPRLGVAGKNGIVVSASLFLCAMSDLMVSGIKDFFEHHIPVLNDINPAALITDAFYALNVYDTYDRFFANFLSLAGLTVVCGIICFLIVRRNRYASL